MLHLGVKHRRPTNAPRQRVKQGCPTKVSSKSVPQECCARLSGKSGLQKCQVTSALQECQASVPQLFQVSASNKSVPQGCQVYRVSHRIVTRGCPARVSSTRVRQMRQASKQACQVRVSHKSAKHKSVLQLCQLRASYTKCHIKVPHKSVAQ